MKRQILFLGKIRKNITILSFAKSAHSMVSVKRKINRGTIYDVFYAVLLSEFHHKSLNFIIKEYVIPVDKHLNCPNLSRHF